MVQIPSAMAHREPLSPHNPMHPVAIKATLTGNSGAVVSADENWYQASTAMPMTIDPFAFPQVFPGNINAPVMDASGGENGVKLKRGVYRFDLQIRAGDVTAAGTSNVFQFAVIKKSTADATGLILRSPELPSGGHAGGDLSLQFWVEDILFADTGFFEVTDDDTTIQVVARRETAGAGAGVIKWGTLVVTKVANVNEGSN